MAKHISLTVLILLLALMTVAQTGTPHGVNVTITAPLVGASSGDGSNVAGYNIYRCPGTCAANNGAWTKIDTSLDLSLGYLDPSSDAALTAGATFSYTATVVDTVGKESAFGPVSTVTIPSSGFPTNPNAPSGCTAQIQ